MKIACDNCNSIIADVVGKSLIEVVRQGHKMQVVGKDYTLVLSCPNTGNCSNKVAITVENGQVLLDNLKRKEVDDNEGQENEHSKSDADGKSEKDEGGESQEGGGSGDDKQQEGNGGEDQAENRGGQEDEPNGTSGGTTQDRKYTRI